ncbi:uncharacterized protein JCM6883_005161 [Sporobolomyces salmoneus]|uniref:uncharacterized protein n=1 Tax=Sporobolomyces salmoneus TaxID=183962 RepID=UPI00317C8D64
MQQDDPLLYDNNASSLSPRILLSPSSPDFPAVDLPLLGGTVDLVEKEERTNIDKTLRHSLLLLDSRLAELKTIGCSKQSGFDSDREQQRLSPIGESKGVSQMEDESELEGGAIDFMLARGSFSGGTTQRDVSRKSLASVASGSSSRRSSEDAFDIVDFPSIEQFALAPTDNLGLAISTRLPPSPRNRSSDLLAFPIPPSDVSLIGRESAATSVENSVDSDQVFEHLASLGGDGQSVHGLGLFSSSTSVSRPSSRLARSETETDSASACSHQSSFMETSTLASSYAPTLGFGRSTTSFFGKEDPCPTPPLYARRAATFATPISPPPMIFTSQPETSPNVQTTLGSPFALQHELPPSPASLSPFSFTESPQQSPTLASSPLAYGSFRSSSIPSPTSHSQTSPASSTMSRSPSRPDGFAEMHQASLGLLGAFDDTGIPLWQVDPGDRYDEDKLEILEEDLSPPPRNRFDSSSTHDSSPRRSTLEPSSPIGTLRRLSSFQFLRRRTSENVLASSTISTSPVPRPVLSKPKSEAALSTLARHQATVEPKSPLQTLDQPPTPGRLGKLAIRSKSSPRLSKLASPLTRSESSKPATPKSPLAESEGGGSKEKKRFSIFTSKQSSSPSPNDPVPPVPATPTEHLFTETAVSPSATPSSPSFPATPTSTLFSASDPPSEKPASEDSITLASFIESTSPKQSSTPKQQIGKNGKTQRSPFGEVTNFSRPTSPALIDALKLTSPLDVSDLVVVPQRITVFPVRLPPAPPGALAAAAAKEAQEDGGGGSDDDKYGGESDSEEDRPLGVTVPGALTAQKSLRKSMSKKKSSSKPRPKEDPFELERALRSTAVSRQPSSSSSRGATGRTFSVDPHVPVPTKSSQGHDSFLPQTDASIERKASSNGLRRSPSTPLDPMIANSALTLDSPILTQEPLPMPIRRDSRPASSPTEVVSSPPVAPPRSRPPPVPTPSSRQQIEQSNNVPPSITRRPSLHPDIAHIQSTSANMQRQASSSSSRSATTNPAPSSPALDSSQPVQQRPPPGARSRSGTVSAASGPAVDHRVYLGRAGAKHLTIKVTDRTVAGEIVAYAKGKGALETGKENEGGWALWEVWQSMGLERPIREYELVNDVVKSFDGDSAVFVLRRTTLWPILSAHARMHPVAPKTAQVQLELKKGKWSKRFLELKGETLSYSKSDKMKDSSILSQLSNFSVFYVDEPTAQRLKAPKPFVFALKSRLTRAHFEEVSQYCNFVSVKSAVELENWISTITEAGNSLSRQREQAVLGSSTTPAIPSPPLLTNKSSTPTSTPFSLAAVTTEAPPRGGFLARNKSSRPAPAVLAPSNENAPLPTRRPTLSKPLVDLSR